MKRILWEMPDGLVRQTIPSYADRKPGVGFQEGAETEEEYIARVMQRTLDTIPDLATAVKILIVDLEDLPHPLSFGRQVWRMDGDAIVIDMAKARAVKTERLRPERDKRLAALDVAYIRADEEGNAAEKTKIAAKKQKLRDLPATMQPVLDAIDGLKKLEAFDPKWP